MKLLKLSTSIIAASLLLSGQVLAAGYYVDEQSALRLGDAFSGGAASASDASAAFYGPASMILVSDEVAINVAGIAANTRFKGGSTTLGGAVNVDGSRAKDDTIDVLPSLYFVKHLDEKLVVGGYLNAPYATGMDFGKDSVVRYQTTESKITGIDAGVSVAVRVNDVLTLGGSLFAQYLKATTETAFHSGALCNELLGDPQCASGADINSADLDGYLKMEGHNTVMGYQVGALVELTDNARIGVNYRSKAKHSLTGDATISFPDAVHNLGMDDIKAPGRVNLTTPDVLNVSYFYQFTDLSVNADVSWTRWSRFDTLQVSSTDSTVSAMTGVPQEYRWSNTIRAAIGANYKLTDDFTIRGGFAFDKTPIDDAHTMVDFPFADYKAVSAGFTYGMTEKLKLDIGAQHTLKQARGINRDDGQGTVIKGASTTEVTTFAAGLRYAL